MNIIIKDSKPKVLKPKLIQLAYDWNAMMLGLFNLFVTRNLMKALVNWTNSHIEKKASLKKYIGLELAMSIVKLNHIRSY